MMDEKVTVIIPVYNAEKTIRRCVDSVISQTYQNLQIILINDGSKDGSLEICYEYQKKDIRIEVLSHENKGVSFTRNQGIKKALGSYMIFIDSDDYIETDMIEMYIKAATKNKVDVVIGGICFINDSKIKYIKYPQNIGLMNSKLFWNCLCEKENSIWGYVPNKLYKTAIIQKNKIYFNENMKAQEDLDFALSVYEVAMSFFAFDYSGYNYEYSEIQRQVPIKDLIRNQQKILHCSKNVGLSEKIYQEIVGKIKDQIYTKLYYCKSIDDIQEILDIPNLIEDMQEIKKVRSEKTLILKWFVNKKCKRILLYFSIRNGIRKILKRDK